MLYKHKCIYFNSSEIKKLYSFYINQKIDLQLSFNEFISICSDFRSVHINQSVLPRWLVKYVYNKFDHITYDLNVFDSIYE